MMTPQVTIRWRSRSRAWVVWVLLTGDDHAGWDCVGEYEQADDAELAAAMYERDHATVH